MAEQGRQHDPAPVAGRQVPLCLREHALEDLRRGIGPLDSIERPQRRAQLGFALAEDRLGRPQEAPDEPGRLRGIAAADKDELEGAQDAVDVHRRGVRSPVEMDQHLPQLLARVRVAAERRVGRTDRGPETRLQHGIAVPLHPFADERHRLVEHALDRGLLLEHVAAGAVELSGQRARIDGEPDRHAPCRGEAPARRAPRPRPARDSGGRTSAGGSAASGGPARTGSQQRWRSMSAASSPHEPYRPSRCLCSARIVIQSRSPRSRCARLRGSSRRARAEAVVRSDTVPTRVLGRGGSSCCSTRWMPARPCSRR